MAGVCDGARAERKAVLSTASRTALANQPHRGANGSEQVGGGRPLAAQEVGQWSVRAGITANDGASSPGEVFEDAGL